MSYCPRENELPTCDSIYYYKSFLSKTARIMDAPSHTIYAIMRQKLYELLIGQQTNQKKISFRCAPCVCTFKNCRRQCLHGQNLTAQAINMNTELAHYCTMFN